MNMKTDEEILTLLSTMRNHSQSTKNAYRSTIKIYTTFQKQTLDELLKEAKKEQKEKIEWTDRKLRTRLINFRQYLYDNYLYSAASSHLRRILTMYTTFELELHKLPYISNKQVQQSVPLTYHDLPDREIIQKALEISSPLMKAIILFISSSGTARAEMLSITIADFIESLKGYTNETDIHKIISDLKDRNYIIPTFKLQRKKVNEYYYTFCSPEATTAIFNYLLTRKKLKNNARLFKTNIRYLNDRFAEINNTLRLGKKGTYNRFRSHMLRKYHSTTLKDCDNKLSVQDIEFLQGRSDSKTRRSYFMTNEEKLRLRYAESMNDITINQKYNVIADYETLSLHIEEYNPEEEIKPLKQQTIDLKKENQKLVQENTEMKENIKVEARKVFEDILKENGIQL